MQTWMEKAHAIEMVGRALGNNDFANPCSPLFLSEATWRISVFVVGREVLISAVRHSEGSRIAVEIASGPGELRVRFRDDGVGIAAEILNGGQPGHFGLSGMRERAEKMDARISIGSRAGAGTEIELRVPYALFGVGFAVSRLEGDSPCHRQTSESE